MIQIEDIFENKEILDIVKKSIKKHSELLLKVNEKLSKLVISHPEIFRRKEESRVKSIRSLIRKFNGDGHGINYISSALAKTDDISGVRLTIATKDQYDTATRLVEESLQSLGRFEANKKECINPDSKSGGYSAVHHVLISNESAEITCEIQIRTLTADLWAVFTHYESYKNNDSIDISRKDEIVNYARLMDVADHYAKLIRERKIFNANKSHKSNCKNSNNKKKPITVTDLQEVLYNFTKKKEDGKDEYDYVTKIDVIELCDTMTILVDHKIFSSSDIKKLMNHKKAINFLNKEVKAIHSDYLEIEVKPKMTLLFEIENELKKIKDKFSVNDGNYLNELKSVLEKADKKIKQISIEIPEMDIMTAFKILMEVRNCDTKLFDKGNEFSSLMERKTRFLVNEWRLQKHYDNILLKDD